MKNSGHSKNRIEVKIEVAQRHKENGGSEATYGTNNFCNQGQ